MNLVRDPDLDRRAARLFREFCADEDPELFRQLFELSGPLLLPLLRLKTRLHRAPLDPAELLTDTFAQVYRARHSFRDRGRGSFVSWVLTIAENLLRQRQREGQRRLRREERAARSIRDHSTDPFARLLREETREAAALTCEQLRLLILEALVHVSPAQEQVLRLHAVHRLGYADIARHLGLSVGAVTMRIKRGRERILAHVLQQLGGPGSPGDPP